MFFQSEFAIQLQIQRMIGSHLQQRMQTIHHHSHQQPIRPTSALWSSCLWSSSHVLMWPYPIAFVCHLSSSITFTRPSRSLCPESEDYYGSDTSLCNHWPCALEPTPYFDAAKLKSLRLKKEHTNKSKNLH